MTKAGIAHLTKCLAVEWDRHNINVNCIAPTFIATPGTEPALSDPKLASPAASLITGDTVMIDGGSGRLGKPARRVMVYWHRGERLRLPRILPDEGGVARIR